jgi:3-isopropylmalate/(R)-2-methylmalate dehydratase small subunit
VIIRGKAIKYGDDINTDVIIPGRYLLLTNPEELAAHAMEDLDPDFIKKFKKGDIIVGGKNFGCGSSREQAAMCLKYAGVGAIIAKSFARIFYRNAINQGLPIIESSEAAGAIKNMDELEIDLYATTIRDKTKNLQFKIQPLPLFIQEILDDGGLVYTLKKKLRH